MLSESKKRAHIFLTGYTLRSIECFDLVEDNDFVITTNLGPLHDFVSSRANAYFLPTNGNIKYKKISELSLEIAVTNCNDDCVFYVKKSVVYYLLGRDPVPQMICRSDLIPFFSRLDRFKTNTLYQIFRNLENFDEVFLWGADYALKKPISGHFYEKKWSYNNPPNPDFELHTRIKSEFKGKVYHICPSENASAFYESVYLP